MTDDLILSANGRDISGWERIEITLTAESFPPEFSIGASALDPATGADLVVRPGDACTIRIGGDLVITGYVDRVRNGGNATSHGINIVGRGKTQDLVDCSAEWDTGQIASATAPEIATKLAQPYGIVVRLANGAAAGPQVPQFNLTYGETGADIIQRVARNAALLAYEAPDGALLLAAVGAVRAASGIVWGENVEDWSVELSMDQRFSEIVCTQLGQDILGDTGDGGLFFDTERDPNVPRHRRRYMTLEQAVDAQSFTAQLARWEVARRAGRALIATATIDSWRDAAGTLWAPNTLVPVSLPGMPMAQDLCIASVTLTRGDEGTRASLTMMPREAFAPEPISLLPLNLSDVSPA